MEHTPSASAVLVLWTVLKQHCLIVTAAVFLARLIFVRYATDLRRIPGPTIASITRLYGGLSALCLCAVRWYELT